MGLGLKDIIFILLLQKNIDTIPIVFETFIVTDYILDGKPVTVHGKDDNRDIIINVLYMGNTNRHILKDLEYWFFEDDYIEHCLLFSGKDINENEMLWPCEWTEAYVIRNNKKFHFWVWVVVRDDTFLKSQDMWPIIENRKRLFFTVLENRVAIGKGFLLTSESDAHIRSKGQGIKFFNKIDTNKYKRYFIWNKDGSGWKIMSFRHY
jgi:hypothetical protein